MRILWLVYKQFSLRNKLMKKKLNNVIKVYADQKKKQTIERQQIHDDVNKNPEIFNNIDQIQNLS
ncbi:unnamed protein product [Paramecium sonneborni]|uniref:Uncharacterized protein n=1 Tax=Paramecium sonneborni TaxID=65129 RepID=A0A8S1RQ12_9CILI|nr:unnamed protein product [Paramecium sonneborni]